MRTDRDIALVHQAPVIQNIPYGTDSPKQTLDLYLPAPAISTPVPLVIIIHGGAFRFGDSTTVEHYARAVTRRGLAAAAINYRLSGESCYPAGAQDVKRAVQWLRAQASAYSIDPGRFAAWGQSAGGFMAAMLGVTGDQSTLFDPAPAGFPAVSTAVQAVVAWYAPTDFLTMDAHGSQIPHPVGAPELHLVEGSPESLWLGEAVTTSPLAASTNLSGYVQSARSIPPFYLAHGTSDMIVAPGQSQQLAATLEGVGAQVRLRYLDRVPHAGAAFEETEVEPSLDFIQEILCR